MIVLSTIITYYMILQRTSVLLCHSCSSYHVMLFANWQLPTRLCETARRFGLHTAMTTSTECLAHWHLCAGITCRVPRSSQYIHYSKPSAPHPFKLHPFPNSQGQGAPLVPGKETVTNSLSEWPGGTKATSTLTSSLDAKNKIVENPVSLLTWVQRLNRSIKAIHCTYQRPLELAHVTVAKVKSTQHV